MQFLLAVRIVLRIIWKKEKIDNKVGSRQRTERTRYEKPIFGRSCPFRPHMSFKNSTISRSFCLMLICDVSYFSWHMASYLRLLMRKAFTNLFYLV